MQNISLQKIWGFSCELYSLFLWILQKKPYIHCEPFTGFLLLHRENLQLLRGKYVNVIGKPHNLFRETLVNIIGKHCRWGNTITFIGKGLQELLKFPTTVFPYNVYKFSLKRLWGSPITFTILPITIKDFPCNFIVVSLCIVFPYHFYKYGMYFPRKSLHSFAVWPQLDKAM